MLRRAVAPEVAHQMNLLLRNVVNVRRRHGGESARRRFTVAGKTGTAQMVNPANGTYYQSRLVSSFVGFLPAEDPRLVILVVLYDVGHGHFGGLIAAPVFSEIAQGAVRDLNITAPAYDTASMIPMPDFGKDKDGKSAAPTTVANVDDYLPVLTGSKLTRGDARISPDSVLGARWNWRACRASTSTCTAAVTSWRRSRLRALRSIM